MSSTDLIRRALYASITNDFTTIQLLGTGTSVYNGYAPEDAVFPLIIFSQQSSMPTYTFGGKAASFDNDLWIVKGVDQNTTADQADAVSAALDNLLTDGQLNISGRETMYCRREEGVSYVETADGLTYYHSGAIFRLLHQ